jgi:hypothetical protein
MSTREPADPAPDPQDAAREPDGAATEPQRGPAIEADPPPALGPGGPAGDDSHEKHRNPWMWVSAGLAVIAVGLLIWGLKTKSDLDSAKQDVKHLEAELSQTKNTGNAAADSYKTAYEDLQKQLGVTSTDLAAAEKDLKDAEQAAKMAEQDAAAAKQQAAKAQNATDKAKAEAEQAQADAKAAEAKTTVASDCASAYASAAGSLLESDDPSSEAAAVEQDLQSISSDCKAALGG